MEKMERDLLTLDEVSEAVGIPRGRVVHLLGEVFTRVKRDGRVHVPLDEVVDFIQSGAVWSAGGQGPSEKWRWMIGESWDIHHLRDALRLVDEYVSRLSDAGVRAALEGYEGVVARLSEVLREEVR